MSLLGLTVRSAPGRASPRCAQIRRRSTDIKTRRHKARGVTRAVCRHPVAGSLSSSRHRPVVIRQAGDQPESTCRSRRCGRTHLEDCAEAANHFMTAGSGGGRGAFTTFGGWNQADYSRCGG
jgi:hypothetical protein